LVTGDDLTCEDANVYAPESERVAVKEYVSRYAAICLTPATTFALQRDAATRAAALVGRVPEVRKAHTIEVEFDAVHLADAAAVVPTVEQISERGVRFTALTMTEAMKAFKVVTAIASGAREEGYE